MPQGISIVVETFNLVTEEADMETLKNNIERLDDMPYKGKKELLVVVNEKEHELQSAMNAFPGVRVVTTKETGYVAMKNAGLRKAKHDWVAFADADIKVHEGWLREVALGLEKYEAVTGRTIYGDNIFWGNTLTLMQQAYAQGGKEKPVEVVIGNNMAFHKKLLKDLPLVETPARGGLRIFSYNVYQAGKKIMYLPKMRTTHHFDSGMEIEKMLTDAHDYIKTIQQAPYLSFVPFPAFWPTSIPLITLKNFLKDLKGFAQEHARLGFSWLHFPIYLAAALWLRFVFFWGLGIGLLCPTYTEKKYGVY